MYSLKVWSCLATLAFALSGAAASASTRTLSQGTACFRSLSGAHNFQASYDLQLRGPLIFGSCCDSDMLAL